MKLPHIIKLTTPLQVKGLREILSSAIDNMVFFNLSESAECKALTDVLYQLPPKEKRS